MYCLLDRKDRATYTELFSSLKAHAADRGYLLSLVTILMDFEAATIKVLRSQFPQTKIHGCYFHYTQTIFRFIKQNGWSCAYRDDNDIRLFLRKSWQLDFCQGVELYSFLSVQ